jgi:hypothetical protein
MSSIAYNLDRTRTDAPATLPRRAGLWARIWAGVVAARQQQALEHIRRFGVINPIVLEQAEQIPDRASGDSVPLVR